jgi:formylglycine-generating enzyme required for sulfatase activity
VLLLVAATACGSSQDAPLLPPLGQLVVYFDTDAPLPAAPGSSLGAGDPLPLFDTLRVDVYLPGASDPQTREFAVDVDLLRASKASVGIAAPPGASGTMVRARLFHAAGSLDGQPPPSATIDVTASLPVVGAEGIVSATVFLPTDSVGQPAGSLDSPVPATSGAPSSSQVESWGPAQRVLCNGSALSDDVCVPGGAFWMGNLELRGSYAYARAVNDANLRLVVLSPFFLQKTEVTVQAYRAAGFSTPYTWSGSYGGTGANDWCTFTKSPGPFEAYPLTCVVHDAAQAYCKARGGDLPSEAQYEFVASRFAGDLYPWGSDTPPGDKDGCAASVWGRAPANLNSITAEPCAPKNPVPALLPPGSGAWDSVDVGGQSVVDLSGSVTEFVLDTWNYPDEPCWSSLGIYRDPVCRTKSVSSPADTLRGGSWLGPAGQAAGRALLVPGTATISIGLRCQRPGL